MKFTERDEKKHQMEDKSRLSPHNFNSSEVIERFLTHESDELDFAIPRRHQSLKDYLFRAVGDSSGSILHSRCPEADIIGSSCSRDIALLDDRQNHLTCLDTCERRYGSNYQGCNIFSGNITIPELYRRLACESWGFSLEFHLPYYAIRYGDPKPDWRKHRGQSLRLYEELPLRAWSKDGELIYFYEAQISSLSIGPVDRRVWQVSKEFTSLIEKYDERMEEYEKAISKLFEDDFKRTHTRTLGEVIEKLQLFADSLSATLDAWGAFYNTRISYFTRFGKPEWQTHIESIVQHMKDLERLRKILLKRLERFRTKLASFSTVSNLKESAEATRQTSIAREQTDAAMAQAIDMRKLTAMTVADFV
ncbi:hypothetical protein K469DRAFT_683025 [Zopfia rhizophila CBS 207.26]|uniref:Uncharacterized protein n=1 Tax=Zopfia rhizophila CBS 207.26 TaxID=1314779 RepID=A0A6A6EC91_9PEZI|nr:hypothetical protein K469DRAFT_683025 [Zopfia rhizophila CBS 207.26]